MQARVNDLGRMARTLAHLRPGQVGHRVRLRATKQALRLAGARGERVFRNAAPRDAGWPDSFVPIDRRDPPIDPPVSSGDGPAFAFVGERHVIVGPADWRPADRSQLFRYNLHYFEWAWALAAAEDRDAAGRAFTALWSGWSKGTVFGLWDEWSPYVAALRTWVLCGVHRELAVGTAIEGELRDAVATHARFLRWNLERDVGGNHLVKNLKALVGAGVFLHDDGLVDASLRSLLRQVEVQVHPDGGHYERSASYHVQVMGDLVDVHDLLAASGRPVPPPLADAVARMRAWLVVMRTPDGAIPPFGDCAPVTSARLRALGVDETPMADGLRVLDDSGYVVAARGRWHAILDVGPPCPPELPAHAQAGCLGFVLSLDGRVVVSELGTSTYVGPRRALERSTAAHSTVELDGADQTEVWSSFRAGRLARPVLHEAVDDGGAVVVRAEHDGYRFLLGRPVHERTWRLSADGLAVTDRVRGTGRHRVVVRFHHPDPDARLVEVTGSVDGRGALEYRTERSARAAAFGVLADAGVDVAEAEVSLPATLRSEVREKGSAVSTAGQEVAEV